jgi:hypothetical protein
MFGLWTIVCVFVFNRWFVDHCFTHRANLSKTGGDLRGSGSVNSSCSTSGTRPLTHVETPMISHGQGKTGLMHIYWLHNVYNPDILLPNHKCLLIWQNYDKFEFLCRHYIRKTSRRQMEWICLTCEQFVRCVMVKYINFWWDDWLPLVEQELFTLPEPLRSPPVLEGFARCVVDCGPWFVSSSSILGLWTIVCLFVFNLWFVDHSMCLRL